MIRLVRSAGLRPGAKAAALLLKTRSGNGRKEAQKTQNKRGISRLDRGSVSSGGRSKIPTQTIIRLSLYAPFARFCGH
jgi:hypothetical protein